MDRQVRPAYDTLLFEIEFNLERARLEGRYAQARSIPIPADGLSKLPDARDWYALYLKRNDISVQPLQWLHSDSWLGRKHYVIVDHDVVPDEKEQHYLRIIRERPP